VHLNTYIKKFNVKDLNQDFYLTRARTEAKSIFGKEGPRRGRSYDEVLKSVKYGHAPECRLIQECSFIDDLREYKDLLHPKTNEEVEIKTVPDESLVNGKLNECAANKTEKSKFYPYKEGWRNFPDIVYMFIGNPKTGDYRFFGEYNWDKVKKKYV